MTSISQQIGKHTDMSLWPAIGSKGVAADDQSFGKIMMRLASTAT